jgi:hypothetical protein
MSELSKLRKENKQLKGLLKDAVNMLDRYKDILKHPERLLPPVKKTRAKTAKARAAPVKKPKKSRSGEL